MQNRICNTWTMVAGRSMAETQKRLTWAGKSCRNVFIFDICGLTSEYFGISCHRTWWSVVKSKLNLLYRVSFYCFPEHGSCQGKARRTETCCAMSFHARGHDKRNSPYRTFEDPRAMNTRIMQRVSYLRSVLSTSRSFSSQYSLS
jgi:hypothetical protein